MSTFLFSFDASVTATGGTPPTLQVLVGGVVVSSLVLDPTETSFDLFVEFSGTAPSSLTIRFDPSSGSPSDSINISNAYINNNNVTTDLTATLLAQGQSSNVNANSAVFGRETPTLSAPDVNGTGGDDTAVNGTNEADSIDALAGNDRIRGRGGDDEINGGAGNDYIFAEDGADTVLGGDGDDIIFGNAGDDVILGEAGNDILIGGADNDVLNGGAGNDSLIGDDGNDILFGEGDSDFLVGGAGDDILFGDEGDDYLIGEEGDDALSGGDGNDQLIGGIGNDLLGGGAGDDELIGEDGDDVFSGNDGNDKIYGGDGNDEALGGADNDVILGGAGNDDLLGETGDDFVNGGAGADTISGGDGADVLHGHGLDAATISDILFNNPDVVYSEQTGSFYQYVNTAVNYAGAVSAASSATLNGVAGHLVNITSATENAYVQGLLGGTTWMGGVDVGTNGTWQWTTGLEAGLQFSDVTGASVFNQYENWDGGQPQNNTEYWSVIYTNGTWHDWPDTSNHRYVIEWESGLFSDDNAIDTIDGGAGDDWIYGYGGNDVLSGGSDNDVIFGGLGNDTIDGGNGGDTILGGAGADIINGGGNNDNILLANGDFAAGESINGGANNDSLVLINATTVDFSTGTLSGLETLSGSFGDDTITLASTQWANFTTIDTDIGTDTINVLASGDISGSGTPTVNNAEDGFLVGTGGNDTTVMTGSQLDAIIFGNGTINLGGGASDSLGITTTSSTLNTFGANDDSLISNTEFITAASATAGVTIDLSAQTEDFDLTGGNFADTITAGSGADTIDGGTGADEIQGAAGDDVIDGGAGNDTIYGDMLGGGAAVQGWSFEYYDFNAALATLADAGFTVNGNRDNSNTPTSTGTTSNFDPGVIDAGDEFALKFSAELTIVTGGTYTFRTNSDDGSELFIDGVEIVSNDGLHGPATVTSAGQALAPGTYLIEITYFENGGGQVLDAEISGPDTGGGFVTLSNFANASVPSTAGTPTNSDDVIDGGTGDDEIYGGRGSDTLNGGDDNDTLYALDNTVNTNSSGATLVPGSTTPVTLFNTDFNGTAAGFSYADGGNNGTDPRGGGLNGGAVTAAFINNDGDAGNGSLEIDITGQNGTTETDVSGTLSVGVNAANQVLNSQITFSYRIDHAGQHEGNEDFSFYFAVDGTQFDTSGGSGPVVTVDDGVDTGWVSVTIDIGTLSAGAHTLTWEAYKNQHNAGNESSFFRLDDITLSGDEVTGTTTQSAGNETLDADSGETNILNGGAGADTLYGSSGNDTLNGDSGADNLFSGSVDTQTALLNSLLAANPNISYSFDTGNFYQWVDNGANINWNTAAGNAAASTLNGVGGRLATITSAAEQAFAEGLAGGNNTYLGGSDTGTEGVWSWDFGGYENGAQFADATGNAVNGWYNNWAGGQPNDGDGTQDYLYLLNGTTWADGLVIGGSGFVDIEAYLVEWEGADVFASLNNNILNGGDGADTLYGSDGQDVFLFDNINNLDTIENFNTIGRDAIDISDILTYDPLTDDIADFVQITEGGGNTTISVDTDGTGGYTAIAQLNGVTGLDLDAMITAENLIVI